MPARTLRFPAGGSLKWAQEGFHLGSADMVGPAGRRPIPKNVFDIGPGAELEQEFDEFESPIPRCLM